VHDKCARSKGIQRVTHKEQHMSAPRIVVATIALVLIAVSSTVFGCASQGPGKMPNKRNPISKGACIVVGGAKAEKMVDQLRISVSIPHENIKLGEVVPFTILVENKGLKPRELLFKSGQKFDVRIENTKGNKIWRWSDGKMFTQMLETLVIDPGKSVIYTAEWPTEESLDKLTCPNKYSAFVKITADGIENEEVKIVISIN